MPKTRQTHYQPFVSDLKLMEGYLQSWPSNLIVDAIATTALTTLYEGFAVLRKKTRVGNVKDFEIRRGAPGWFEVIMNLYPTEEDPRDRVTARISVALADEGRRREGLIRFIEDNIACTYRREANGTTSVFDHDAREKLVRRKIA